MEVEDQVATGFGAPVLLLDHVHLSRRNQVRVEDHVTLVQEVKKEKEDEHNTLTRTWADFRATRGRPRADPALDYGSGMGHERDDASARKRSCSPLPDLMWPADGDEESCAAEGVLSDGEVEESYADRSPELIISKVDSDPEHDSYMSDYCDAVECRAPVDYSAESTVPAGDPPTLVNVAVSAAVSEALPIAPLPVRERARARISGRRDDWLLDPTISTHCGMLVIVRGSREYSRGAAWHRGDYEGARGVVLSVHNTGPDNDSFPSTARVKFTKPLNPSLATFTVPTSILRAEPPDAEGQDALIIGGDHRGHKAKLLEEVSDGWFVAAAYDYFEVAREHLVRLLPVEG